MTHLETLRQQFYAAVEATYQPDTPVYFRHCSTQHNMVLAYVHSTTAHRVTVRYMGKHGSTKYKSADYRRFLTQEQYDKAMK